MEAPRPYSAIPANSWTVFRQKLQLTTLKNGLLGQLDSSIWDQNLVIIWVVGSIRIRVTQIVSFLWDMINKILTLNSVPGVRLFANVLTDVILIRKLINAGNKPLMM